jgi:hypothetical protein
MAGAVVRDSAYIGNTAKIFGEVGGRATVYGYVGRGAVVRGSAVVPEGATLEEGAEVFHGLHVVTMSPPGLGRVTLYRAKGGGHRVIVGCQRFTLDDKEAVEKLAREHGYRLPAGWKSLRKYLLATVKSWDDIKEEEEEED